MGVKLFDEADFKMSVDRLGKLKWVLQRFGRKDSNMLISLIALGIKLSVFLCQTVFTLKHITNVKLIVDIVCTYPTSLLAVLKMVLIIIDRERVDYFYRMVQQRFWDPSVAITGEVTSNIQARFNFINLIAATHISNGVLFTFFYMAFPFLSIPEGRTRRLPTLICFPFNVDKSPLHEVLVVILSWNIFMTTVGNVLFDYIFVYSHQHVRAQFVLLRDLLENLTKGVMEDRDDREKFISKEFQNIIFKRLKICVEHHNILLQYCGELQQFSSRIMGLHLITTFVTITASSYVLLKGDANFQQVLMLTLLLGIISTEVIIFCILGTELCQESMLVADAAFQCEWNIFKRPLRRGLTLLINNSQKGIEILAAGLVPMKNELIPVMGQRIFSAITLMQSFDEVNTS